MRDASPAVIALLATKQYVYADCYSFFLKSGTVLRYTTAQRKVRWQPPDEGAPVTFGTEVLMTGLQMTSTKGLSVDEQECLATAAPDTIVDGQPFLTAVRLGYFDGATCTRNRAYAPSWGTAIVGGITLFAGRISGCQPAGGTKATMKVKAETVTLDQPMPRNYFQTGCKNTLFDTGCALVKSAFAVEDNALSGSTNQIIHWAAATAGEYDQGTVTMETGANVGVSRTIRQSNGTQLILVFPFEFPVGTGDQFKAYPGCDLTETRCAGPLFNNKINFRGFPFVPPPQVAF